MNILLINPNRYKSPPVPPIGLEYISSCLIHEGHKTKILDMCFSEDPYNEINYAIKSLTPDIIGITIRNVDTVLFLDNEFFLDDIKEIVGSIRSQSKAKIIIGGTGLSTNPEGVLEFLKADFAVVGPAETMISGLLQGTAFSESSCKIHYGQYNPHSKCQRLINPADYRKYLENGGIAGFETHKGCSSSCVYCIEANSRVRFKNIEQVLSELREFVDNSINHFHLCDSEFNEDLDFSVEFCERLKKSGIAMKWAIYMKPANYNKKLFRLMKETCVYLITLTVDSWKKCPIYWDDIEKIVFNAKSIGIKIVVDFLAGFPYEDEDTLRWYLDFFRRIQPDRVGVNTYIRLYKSLFLTEIILRDNSLWKHLAGNIEDKTMIRPVFYNHVDSERLKGLIAGDSLFKIEGFEKGVNYSKV